MIASASWCGGRDPLQSNSVPCPGSSPRGALPAFDPELPVLDTELLERYDRPGPRYTSYPAAPQFTTAFGPDEFRDHAARSNERTGPRPLSLYVHVPFCFSPCFYCGCNRLITRDTTRGALYVERLLRESALLAPLFDREMWTSATASSCRGRQSG